MPWSPWIQSDPYERGTLARYRMLTQTGATDYTGGTIDEVVGDAESALYSGASTEAETTVYGQLSGANPGASRFENYTDAGTPGTWTGGIVQTQGVAWFDTDDLELATWREWFPPELDGLVEGVDYGVRPDRTGSEDDAFIEYEDGVGQIEGWTGFAPGRITSITGSFDTPHATAKWRLLSPPPTVPAIPDPFGSVSASPLALTPADGSPIAQIVNATTTGAPSGVPVNLAIAGPVSEFAVLIITDESSDIPFSGGDPGDSTYIHGWTASGLIGSAGANVRLPRWRYWIPRQLPLQQIQRGNDGLGLRGTRSWKNRTSRQATNRWRANL